ncbi:MAG TPA: ABC transporter permease subunit [Mobilitalea sp.]|nr:ABC transporter permease subunit [Mobilitalea sp.]
MKTDKLVKTTKERITDILFYVYRIIIILLLITLCIPAINPANVSELINDNMSLFTSGIDYASLTAGIIRAVTLGWVQESSFVIIFISCMVIIFSYAGIAVNACMSLGSLKMRRLGNIVALISSVTGLAGMGGIYQAYVQLCETSKPEKVGPHFPFGFIVIVGALLIILVFSLLLLMLQPKPDADDVYELKQKYKLFLLLSPFILLTFVFSYLQLWGWRYAFYDYNAGDTLSKDNFVGFKWFTYLFQNSATRSDIVRVIRNTMAMSGLGIATSWCAMAFAIFLCEIKSLRIRRFIQTCTTIPNFISWVMVYSFAFVLFSSEGLVSNLIVRNGGTAVNFLMNGDHIWLKMLLWGMWKGIGWSAIIYIAGISGIDQQLYEAATVDGAGRFQRMWHITVPGLLPTFLVLLLMQIAGILSNGLDQYLVFRNPNNASGIEVLDLYVYRLGIGSGVIPLSTVVGMCKSLISVALLLVANRASKMIRGNSIV